MRRLAFTSLFFAVALVGQASAQTSPGLGEAFTDVRDALAKGYGGMCSLEMYPVQQGGYYRCMDIGPYRFVEEYGKSRGFVLAEGQAPFEIAVSDDGGTRFVYQGPWTTDLTARVAEWKALEIGGGRVAEETAMSEAQRVQAARDSVDAYLKSLEPVVEQPAAAAQPPAQATSVAPQVYYIVPPNFTPNQPAPQPVPLPTGSQEIPVTGIPTPGLVQQGVQSPGVLVAPGVVAYPTTP